MSEKEFDVCIVQSPLFPFVCGEFGGSLAEKPVLDGGAEVECFSISF